MTKSEIYLNLLRMYRALARGSSALNKVGTQIEYVEKLRNRSAIGDIGAAVLKCSIRSNQSVDYWFEGITHPDYVKQWDGEVFRFVNPPPLRGGIPECPGIMDYVRKQCPNHFFFDDWYI